LEEDVSRYWLPAIAPIRSGHLSSISKITDAMVGRCDFDPTFRTISFPNTRQL
jgi:hypothetical protein